MPVISQLCTFYLDDLYLGVEVEKVQEVIRYQKMTRVPLAPSVVRGLINLRGQIVLAIDMRCRMSLPSFPADHLPMNVIIGTESGPVSLLVDEIGEVLEVDESDFGPVPETLRGRIREMTSGAFRLHNGLLLKLNCGHAISLTAADHDRNIQ